MNRKLLTCAFAVLAASAPSSFGQGRLLTIDDFEDGDRRAAAGLSWISLADELMGGASRAELRNVAAGKGRALRVTGELAADGFAGAWVALDGRARATDVSDFSGIRLRLRGAGAVRVELRAGPMPGLNYAAAVAVRPDWTDVDVPFAKLEPPKPDSPALDPKSARWLGVTVKGAPAGPFEFEIDDVVLYASRPDARLRVQEGPAFFVPLDRKSTRLNS